MNYLTQLDGYALLCLFFVLSAVLIYFVNRGQNTLAKFLVADRGIGLFVGAISIAVTWIWAPAIFVAGHQAYTKGIAGLFWFTLPNVLAPMLFAFLAVRMKEIFVHGFTLPEFIGAKMGAKSENLYAGMIFLIQIYAVVLQFTASVLMLNMVTGISKVSLVVVISTIMLFVSASKGLRSSLTVDIIKAALIFLVVGVLVPWSIQSGGGWPIMVKGLGGLLGNIDIFNAKVAWEFGIPISATLLSGMCIDQQMWQRSFSFGRDSVGKSFFWGGVIFSVVPIALGVLGFVALGSGIAIPKDSQQLAGLYVVGKFLPTGAVIVFVFTVLAALVAAGSSALNAACSVGAIDVWRRFRSEASDQEMIWVSRATMLVTIIGGAAVSLSGKDLVSFMLMIGALRSSFLVPTILALFWERVSANWSFVGIFIGLLVGVYMFFFGDKSLGILLSLLISSALCVFGTVIEKVLVQEDSDRVLA